MLGTAISKIQQKVGIFKDLCIAKVSLLTLLCNNIIAAGIDLVTRIAQFTKFQFAQIKLSIEPLVAQFTNQVPLMKLGLMNVLHKAGDLGQQLLTIARKILQRVYKVLKQEH